MFFIYPPSSVPSHMVLMVVSCRGLSLAVVWGVAGVDTGLLDGGDGDC